MTSEIRLLSLWQPWASFISHGVKHYETRSWQTSYRGRIAIHAAKRPVNRDELAEISANSRGHLNWQEVSVYDFPLGCIVAIADLADCLEMIRDVRLLKDGQICINTEVKILERAVGDWKSGRFAWKLENVRPPAQPIPYRGAQGLRRITDQSILDAIEQQLAYTAQIEQQLKAVGGER